MATETSEPEATETIKGLRWIWHHIVREGSVIRGAPGAFILAILITGGFEYWYLNDRFEDRYSGQIAGLNGTIQEQQAQIQLQDAQLGASKETTSGSTTIGEARLQLVRVGQHNYQKQYGVNIAFVNVGSLASIGDIENAKSELTDHPLSPADLDQRYDQFAKNEIESEKQQRTNEIQPHESMWWTQPSKTITSQDIETYVHHGKDFLYTFIRVKYRDDALPNGKWRVTEVCLVTWDTEADHRCAAHNSISLSD